MNLHERLPNNFVVYILKTILSVNPENGLKGDWDIWVSDLVKNPDGTDI